MVDLRKLRILGAAIILVGLIIVPWLRKDEEAE
jgi:uncharacterized protein YjeT (DUF2065 family)